MLGIVFPVVYVQLVAIAIQCDLLVVVNFAVVNRARRFSKARIASAPDLLQSELAVAPHRNIARDDAEGGTRHHRWPG